MHCLLQDMGKEIVRSQSNEPGEREFLVDSKDICDLLENTTVSAIWLLYKIKLCQLLLQSQGSKKVLGITMDMDEIDELHIHENAFKGMRNLLFLKIYTNKWDMNQKQTLHLPKGFNFLPPKLKLLRLDGYPMRHMPINFHPENLVKLQLSGSKLEKLWEGVHALRGLKELDLKRSTSLKEIPDLSMAINLKTLDLADCSSLVELPSSIQYLNKLKRLGMTDCINLETLPTGIDIQSLDKLNLEGCSRLKSFPVISTNIIELILDETSIEEFPINLCLKKIKVLSMCSMKSAKLWNIVQPLTPLMNMLCPTLERLFLSDIPSLVELPSSIENLYKLEYLEITYCINLETIPTNINLPYLYYLELNGCSSLKTFPNISTNISQLELNRTSIEEVPWWIENFSKLEYLSMNGCNKLQCVSLHITKLKNLHSVDFSDCLRLTKATWNDNFAVETDNTHSKSQALDESSSSFPGKFIDCFHLDQEALFDGQLVFFKFMILSGEEVPSYFTHCTTGNCLANIPLLQTSISQQHFRFRTCAIVDSEYSLSLHGDFLFRINVSCRFGDKLGNYFDSSCRRKFWKDVKGIHLVIFECSFRKDNASVDELNYDHVGIKLHLSNVNDSTSTLKGWGVRMNTILTEQ